MDVDGYSVARLQRMFPVRENFDAPKIANKQSAQTGAGEKVFVIGLEQMPGNDAPVMQIRKHLDVRDGEKSAPTRDPRDFGDERRRVLRMLDDFDADR